MAIRTVVTEEEFADLPEHLQGEYAKAADGKYYADLDDSINQHPKVSGLANALDRFKQASGVSDPRKLKARLDEAQTIRERFGDLDPEDAAAAIARLEELESGEGDKDREAEIKRIREGLETKYTKQLDEKDTRINRLTKSVEDREIRQKITAALSKLPLLEGVEDGARLVLMDKSPKVVWDEDEARGVFVGELGEEIDVSTFVEAWSKTKEGQGYMRESGNRGSNSSNNRGAGGSGGKNPWAKDSRNLTEQGRIMKENPALAKQLKAAAGY